MNEKEREFAENASSVLRLWAAYAISGGFDKSPGDVPAELLDLEDRVSTEVPALIAPLYQTLFLLTMNHNPSMRWDWLSQKDV